MWQQEEVLFKDRREAGRLLAEKILPENIGLHPLVLGIPRGGLEIGLPIAKKLACPLEPVTLRKLPLPQDDQMGLGAVTIDHQVILNDALVQAGYVRTEEIPEIVEEVYREVQRRDRQYRGDRPFPSLKGRSVVIADDGLATGYTMLAAIKFARQKDAAKIIAAVPVAQVDAWELITDAADEVICLHIDRHYSFAVASFYEQFPDLSDDYVVACLRAARKSTS